ncbi:uncharacterized protein [Montipora capricornis]|uniref:uncharacterized protein n=1 Tax=Montipora capricornis TaxID=246305 RepID=UPI0035F1F559
MCAMQRSFFCGRGFTVYDNCSIQQTEKEKSFRFSVGGQFSELMLIDAESPLCRMCRSKGETVAHVVSECGNLVQTEYKGGRHDNVAWIIHWQLCGKCGLERANSWYEQKPEGVVESENFKILWDFTVQCDRKVEARRPYIVFRPERTPLEAQDFYFIFNFFLLLPT